ncbi:MAG TPA: hypothetical protein VMV03_17810 [Spirochaetia bacterium]|nr:hypothetical protein [Spirochaetia bacterium]
MKLPNLPRLLLWSTMLLSCAGPVFAAALSVGLGVSNISVQNDANGVSGGSGSVAVAFGFELIDTWSVEMFMSGGSVSTGVPQSIYYPPDTADYGILFAGIRKSLWSLNDHVLTPWIEVGAGFPSLVWHTYAYNTLGVGLALAGGLDLGMGPLVLRGQYLYQRASTSDPYGFTSDVSGQVFSLLVMIRFRW